MEIITINDDSDKECNLESNNLNEADLESNNSNKSDLNSNEDQMIISRKNSFINININDSNSWTKKENSIQASCSYTLIEDSDQESYTPIEDLDKTSHTDTSIKNQSRAYLDYHQSIRD
ncbi:32852_t:CDS:2, partial [Racocetra persica]